MIDNYDSFTYNIVQYCLELGADLKVIRNDEMDVGTIDRLNPEKIIISPGPATPNEAGVSLDVIVLKAKSRFWEFVWGIRVLRRVSAGRLFGRKI